MHKVYRYQICDGESLYVSEVAQNCQEFCRIAFDSLGTSPCLGILDLETNTLFDWDKIEDITGVMNEVWDKICDYRMYINCLSGVMQSQLDKSYKMMNNEYRVDTK